MAPAIIMAAAAAKFPVVVIVVVVVVLASRQLVSRQPPENGNRCAGLPLAACQIQSLQRGISSFEYHCACVPTTGGRRD